MKKSDPLLELLSSASQVGQLDSEGSFTIAGEAAIGKLASFQLPRSSAWILKMVQAAVSAQAPELRIAQSNETTTFVFQPQVDFELGALKEALLSPQIQGSPPTRHLAVGLRAVGFGDGRAFTLAFDQGNQRTILGWNNQQLVQRAEALEKDSPPTIYLGVAFPESDQGRSLGGLTKSKGRATTEYLEVARHCDCCPIALYLDGRRIDALQAPPPDEAEGNTAILSLGWAPHSPTQRVPPLRVPPGTQLQQPKWRPTDKFTDERVFLLDGDLGNTQANCIIKLRYGYKVQSHRSKHKSFAFQAISRRSYYNWVKDGVICYRRASGYKSSPISFEIYLSADDIPTDISGFHLQSSEELTRRETLAREQVLFQAENTLLAIDQHIPKPFGVHSAIAGAVTLGVTLMAPFTAGKSLLGTFMLFNLAVSAYDKKKIMDDCQYHLRRTTDRLKNPDPF